MQKYMISLNIMLMAIKKKKERKKIVHNIKVLVKKFPLSIYLKHLYKPSFPLQNETCSEVIFFYQMSEAAVKLILQARKPVDSFGCFNLSSHIFQLLTVIFLIDLPKL